MKPVYLFVIGFIVGFVSYCIGLEFNLGQGFGIIVEVAFVGALIYDQIRK